MGELEDLAAETAAIRAATIAERHALTVERALVRAGFTPSTAARISPAVRAEPGAAAEVIDAAVADLRGALAAAQAPSPALASTGEGGLAEARRRGFLAAQQSAEAPRTPGGNPHLQGTAGAAEAARRFGKA